MAWLISACGAKPPGIYRAPEPSTAERYCAWFGDARGDVLYFGIAAFWSAMRAAGDDPRADLAVGGPQEIGRFDLARERFLEPLPVGPEDAPGGVWDVLAHPDGWIWFTTFFGLGGRVDPRSGRVEHFAEAGAGLNELTLGPEGQVIVSRYASDASGAGSLLLLGPDGAPRRTLRLAPAGELAVAAKSVAWDPLRGEIWVNTDLLDADGRSVGHDARVLDLEGRERLRFARPELQFVRFAPDGTGWLAERDGRRLWLRVRPPERAAAPLPLGPVVALDDDFPPLDFVQELRALPDGSALVTRWSGVVHRAWPDGRVEDLPLPRARGALYYTAVLHDGRVCATRCGAVEVVCRDAR